jgi:hypothetical protein
VLIKHLAISPFPIILKAEYKNHSDHTIAGYHGCFYEDYYENRGIRIYGLLFCRRTFRHDSLYLSFLNATRKSNFFTLNLLRFWVFVGIIAMLLNGIEHKL